MATNKLVGQNYTTPDLVAKVTGQAKYAEDFKADGMLFVKLLVSPMPHARVKRIDSSAALAMPGVKGILTADELAPPADSVNDLGQVIKANTKGEKALTNEDLTVEKKETYRQKRDAIDVILAAREAEDVSAYEEMNVGADN